MEWFGAGMHDGGALARHQWNFEAGQRLPVRASVSIERLRAGAVWAKLEGTVDTSAQPRVTQDLFDLLRLPIKALTLDLEGVTFIDGAGIGLLIVARTQAEFVDIEFTLEHVPPSLRQAMDRAGLLATFSVSERAADE
jgi:anti-anti-sigma factor